MGGTTMEISGVAQVAVPVADLARAHAFYRDVLGLTSLFEAPGMAFLSSAKRSSSSRRSSAAKYST